MKERMVRLESNDERWIELSVKGARASAKVGDAESFPFSFENLGYVASGMGYQAWGGGSHFAFRPAPSGVALEFQGPKDRQAAVLRLSTERLRGVLEELGSLVPTESRASLV